MPTGPANENVSAPSPPVTLRLLMVDSRRVVVAPFMVRARPSPTTAIPIVLLSEAGPTIHAAGGEGPLPGTAAGSRGGRSADPGAGAGGAQGATVSPVAAPAPDAPVPPA